MLTDCGSIVDHLEGIRQIGSEKRLLGHLAQLRERLVNGEITAIGHVVGIVNLPDPTTKYASPLLWALLDALCSGWCDITSPKTDFSKVARHRALR